MRNLIFLAVATLALSPLPTLAQSAATTNSYELSVTAGPFLPYAIPRTREILKGWDLRATVPTGKGSLEVDGFFANAEGVDYKTIGLDYRIDLPNDVFPAYFSFGLNADFFTPTDGLARYAGGWHFGGGLFQPLTDAISLREDLRYRYGPGQSVLLLIGFSFRATP